MLLVQSYSAWLGAADGLVVGMKVVVVLFDCCWLRLSVLALVMCVLWVLVSTSGWVLVLVAVPAGIRCWMLLWMPVLVLASLVAAVLSAAGRRRSWCLLAWARPCKISLVRCAALVACR